MGLLEPLGGWRIPVLHHPKCPHILRFRVNLQPFHRRHIQPQGLLDHHMTTGGNRLTSEVDVAAIGSRHNNDIHIQ